MKIDDLVMYYHSQQELAIVGIMKVTKEAYPDPTSSDPQWLTCDFLRANRRSNINLYPDDWKQLPIPDVPLTSSNSSDLTKKQATRKPIWKQPS